MRPTFGDAAPGLLDSTDRVDEGAVHIELCRVTVRLAS